MFPEYINKSISDLYDIYKNSKNSINKVIAKFPVIEIIKLFHNREISLKLFYTEEGLLEIQPPDVVYHSTISHYDFSGNERRWVRNKDYLLTLIQNLKRVDLWQYVVNKDFLILNQFNKNVNPKKLIKLLNEITSD